AVGIPVQHRDVLAILGELLGRFSHRGRRVGVERVLFPQVDVQAQTLDRRLADWVAAPDAAVGREVDRVTGVDVVVRRAGDADYVRLTGRVEDPVRLRPTRAVGGALFRRLS